ncbi:MAG: glyoxalase/bleomycin resistance/extradiol dioxygenase family protein [Tabrizicola sp.]|nr:glyoxalase/bleomycin resistance/extradiol dioxygenase family protein [Tabrizicola sp.]
MRFVNPLPLVQDMARSVAFYRAALGLELAEDHGDFVRFDGGFALHEEKSYLRQAFQDTPEPGAGQDRVALYFETDDLDAAFARAAPLAGVIHGIRKQAWGGRVFRLRDPDGHIVEVGEA